MAQFESAAIDVRALLDSVTKNYAINEEELYYKWESWCFKMGNNPQLNIENATLFKQDIQNQLEFTNQAKMRQQSTPASTRKVLANGNNYENL